MPSSEPQNQWDLAKRMGGKTLELPLINNSLNEEGRDAPAQDLKAIEGLRGGGCPT